MDDELQIVVSSVLEADETASAKRIASQLPEITRRVNEQSKIKIQAEIDDKTLQTSTQQISRSLSNAAKMPVGIKVNIDTAAIDRFKTELRNLHVSDNITSAISAEMDAMGVRIDKISGAWREAEDEEQRMLNLTIQGTDQMGRQVQIAKQFTYVTQEGSEELREQSSTVTRLTSDLEKARQTEARMAAQAKSDNESRISYLTKQESILQDIQAKYTGATSAKGILDADHLTRLNDEYNRVANHIAELRAKSGDLSKAQRADIDAQIANLKRLVAEYQNAEYVATQLRTRNVATVNANYGSDLDDFEKKLKSSGALTAEFEQRIGELRTNLKTAFDSTSLTNFLNQFDKLKSDVASFQSGEKLRLQIESINAQMESMPTTIAALQARFGQLVAPTETLTQRISQLQTLSEAVSRETNENRKIEAYRRLAEMIELCSKEMTDLNRVQNIGVRDVRLTEGIEKLRADIETTGRTWSAFKGNLNLNSEFRRISQQARSISSWPELQKLTAQFNTFKSEVKAAGLNVQSLGDTLKNNLGKVLQWVSATTLLFRAIRILKSAIGTITALDTAMIDLRKVTKATNDEYREFYKTANETAKRLNATTEAVISQTAEWARLGYAMQDAAKLAENSMIFAAVSPGMEQSEATDGLVSIIKAYGIDVEDTLDGIISKVNEVGNKFAVSNADIVEALTRSSSAMAAANNTFEETVALATAAIEITRDAATVGNGLKTLSMRIRGYDEETEEYSEDIAILTGKIADLTKTASNKGGVSLFEKDDPNTYRSTYAILKDIAEIWDEITDKNRATLLEALFGKRQAQIGSAILSNFSQAEDAIKKMEESAGSAEREMAKVMDSVEYRFNALKETWTGVAQNLVETDDMKTVIAFFQSLSNVVDAATEALGLFGTMAVAGTIATLSRLKSAATTVSASIMPVITSLGNKSFFGSSADTLQYVAALNELDLAQQRVTLSAMGYSKAEQQKILSMTASLASLQRLSVGELEEQLEMEKGRIAKLLNVQATNQLTEAQLRQLISEKSLTTEERARIVALLSQTAATNGARLATEGFNTSLKASIALMLSTPMGWITLLSMLIPILISVGKAFKDAWDAAHPPLEQLETEYQELQDELSSLSSEAEDAGKRIAELEELAANGDISLVEEQELDRLRSENKLLEAQIDLYKKLNEAKKQEIADKARSDAEEFLEDKGYKEYHGGDYITQTYTGAGGLKSAIYDYQKAEQSYLEEIQNGEEANTDLLKLYNQQKLDALEKIQGLESEMATLRKDMFYDADGNAEQIKQLERLMDEADIAVNKADGYQRIFDRFFASIDDVNTDSVAEFVSYLEELGYATDNIDLASVAAEFKEVGDAADTNAKRVEFLTDRFADLNASLDEIKAHGGTADLLNRPVVEVTSANLSKVQGLGMTDAEVGSKMTVASQTIQSGETAIVVTPILPNGEVLSQKELDKYMKSVIASGKKKGNYADYDTKGLLLGVFGDKTTFAENNKMAEDFAVRLHEIHEAMLDVEDTEGLNALIAELRELTEYDPSITAMAEKFSDLEEKIGKLSTGMKEFSDDGSITIKTLAEIGSVFGDFDSFENFAKTLTDTSSTMEQVQQAADDLATEYVNSTTVLDMLRDGNEELVKSMLENIGVTNADEVVEARLAAIRLEDKLAAMGLADATWEVAKQKLQEAGATETAIAALESYRQSQVNAKIAATDFVSANAATIQSLLQQAQAAGMAGKAMDILAQMKSLEASASEGMKLTYQYGAAMTRYKNQLQAALTEQVQISVPDVKVSVPQISSGSSKSGGSSTKSTKETERYIAEIDRFREAVKRLEDTQEEAARIEGQLDRAENLREQINIRKQLIDVYGDEQAALHNLNEERRAAIADGIDKLTQLGFEIEYDPTNNDLYIKNLEHLNELATEDLTKYETMADMSVNIIGQYENAQEATNGLIKDTEGIIDNITAFNEANKNGSESWWELRDAIHSAKQSIIDDLKQIVENAHDAVDEIQNVYDTLHDAADEFAANDGFITVDTYQSILKLGAEYMQYLRDENGLLVINEENIQKVIAARTEQLALEQALTYVERLRMALEKGAIEDLNRLLYATVDATDATWGLVYANLALLDLTDDQYAAARHNIDSIRSLADIAIQSIGKSTEAFSQSLQDMKTGLDDILKYVMDMLKTRIDEQIQALEDQKTAYGEIIDRQKEMLRNTKKQNDYQKSVASKLKEMAKLQAQIDALRLDTSREAQAKRVKLEEELADLQESLADEQNEHAIAAAEDALDKQKEAYEQEKDQEIAVLQNSISSYQKLYDMAISYIENNWNTLYDELIDWNTEYGNVLNDEITTAWDNCLKAAQRYGSYVSALQNIDADISAAGSSGTNYTVGTVGNYNDTATNRQIVQAIVANMKALSAQWSKDNSKETNDALHAEAAKYAAKLDQYGVHAQYSNDGYWTITRDDLDPSNVGKLLYSVYHSGTPGAGNVFDTKQEEVFAKLKKGEMVLTQEMVNELIRHFDMLKALGDTFSEMPIGTGGLSAADLAALGVGKTVSNVTNDNSNQPVVSFGDTYIYGASTETVREHEEVSRRQVNEVLKYIHVKR